MTTIPTLNTNEELKINEEQCYVNGQINHPSLFEAFRLYLPCFPRQDINSLIEIPFLLARQFALSVENYFYNSIHLLTIADYDTEKMKEHLAMMRYKRFVKINLEHNQHTIQFNNLKHEYSINNMKHHIGNVNVEIFKHIPSFTKKYLIDNSLYYLENQCCWFINLLGFFYFEHVDICIRMTESCCLNLNRLNDIFLREKEIIDCDTKMEVCRFLLAELLVAIDFLHERGIVHRFLNPEHVYFDFRGHVKIGNLYEVMNTSRDLLTLFENWSSMLEEELGFTNRLYQKYLDPEVLNCLLSNKTLEAYMQMDCLADIFSIGIMVVESLSGFNLLSLNMWKNIYGSLKLPINDHSHLVNIFLKPEMQMILRQRLAVACGTITPTFYAILLLILQPKCKRMKGLRLNVQRHRYLKTSGCEYKLRMSLVKRHPAFTDLSMNNLILQSSPITRLLTILNSS